MTVDCIKKHLCFPKHWNPVLYISVVVIQLNIYTFASFLFLSFFSLLKSTRMNFYSNDKCVRAQKARSLNDKLANMCISVYPYSVYHIHKQYCECFFCCILLYSIVCIHVYVIGVANGTRKVIQWGKIMRRSVEWNVQRFERTKSYVTSNNRYRKMHTQRYVFNIQLIRIYIHARSLAGLVKE